MVNITKFHIYMLFGTEPNVRPLSVHTKRTYFPYEAWILASTLPAAPETNEHGRSLAFTCRPDERLQVKASKKLC